MPWIINQPPPRRTLRPTLCCLFMCLACIISILCHAAGANRPQATFLKKELLHSMQAIDELFQANQASAGGLFTATAYYSAHSKKFVLA